MHFLFAYMLPVSPVAFSVTAFKSHLGNLMLVWGSVVPQGWMCRLSRNRRLA